MAERFLNDSLYKYFQDCHCNPYSLIHQAYYPTTLKLQPYYILSSLQFTYCTHYHWDRDLVDNYHNKNLPTCHIQIPNTSPYNEPQCPNWVSQELDTTCDWNWILVATYWDINQCVDWMHIPQLDCLIKTLTLIVTIARIINYSSIQNYCYFEPEPPYHALASVPPLNHFAICFLPQQFYRVVPR